jgi:hypothetical protein
LKNTETSKYAQMGMAALLPGMQYMIERMQEQLDEMRLHLAALQGAPALAAKAETRGSSWKSLTPEERSAEMKRRRAVAGSRKGAAKRWAKMTKKQREEWKAKIQDGRKRAKKVPTVAAAKAAGKLDGRAAA